ncbi:MAG: hypothetical protein MPL62_09015 [Alphaproteobacteria bacterium]|nr:hypothetical protein [Alphaproteobacteria bacterium]
MSPYKGTEARAAGAGGCIKEVLRDGLSALAGAGFGFKTDDEQPSALVDALIKRQTKCCLWH